MKNKHGVEKKFGEKLKLSQMTASYIFQIIIW